uniref:Uncharacterized protein n=1 Tax=Amphimedon queenslandica TaxID=400682 RepID=A0A1X7VDF8_AMPQE
MSMTVTVTMSMTMSMIMLMQYHTHTVDWTKKENKVIQQITIKKQWRILLLSM